MKTTILLLCLALCAACNPYRYINSTDMELMIIHQKAQELPNYTWKVATPYGYELYVWNQKKNLFECALVEFDNADQP
jgi:hypothetical protein